LRRCRRPAQRRLRGHHRVQERQRNACAHSAQHGAARDMLLRNEQGGGPPRLEFCTFRPPGAYGNDGTRCSQPACRHDLLRCTVTTILSRLRDSIGPHLAPPPSARDGWPHAGAIEYASFRKAGHRGYDTRPIAIGTEGHQVSSEALRAFYAMANAIAHDYKSNEKWRGHWALTGIARKAGESPVVELEAPPTIWPDELISLA